MTELKSLAIQLIEENVTLQVENDNLKALMAKSEQDVESTKANSESPHNKNQMKMTLKVQLKCKNLYQVKTIWLFCIVKVFIFVMVNYLVNIVMVKIVYYA